MWGLSGKTTLSIANVGLKNTATQAAMRHHATTSRYSGRRARTYITETTTAAMQTPRSMDRLELAITAVTMTIKATPVSVSRVLLHRTFSGQP